MENLKEFTHIKRCDVRINRDDGVLFGVKIIGSSSRNGRDYPNETLRDAAVLYENAKVNLDHPLGDPNRPRSYQDRFGVIRNVMLREDDGLYADFHFNPKHVLAEQLLWDAEHAPENVGFSHNVEAVVRRDKERMVVEKIVSVRSVDLVADPATTSGLFEGVSDDVTAIQSERIETVLLEEIRQLRQRVEEILRVTESRRDIPIAESVPICREQFLQEEALDCKSFVKSICY